MSTTSFPSLRTEPQLICGGMMPIPKKLSPLSASIAPPTPNVKEMKNIGASKGVKYFKIIFKRLTPESFNILIKGFEEIAKLSERMSLAIPIQPVIEMTIISIITEAFIYEINAKRRKKVGKVKNKSIMIIMPLSTLPRKKPADTPMISPKKEAISAEPTPIIKETFPPSIIRAKTSRPSLSVPIKCSAEGGKSMEVLSSSKGESV